MVNKNKECVKQGSISFLIAQHGYMQGYSSIDSLFQAIVLKKEVTPVNYVPPEFLTKENGQLYRRRPTQKNETSKYRNIAMMHRPHLLC